jgi:hypothetical protein
LSFEAPNTLLGWTIGLFCQLIPNQCIYLTLNHKTYLGQKVQYFITPAWVAATDGLEDVIRISLCGRNEVYDAPS